MGLRDDTHRLKVLALSIRGECPKALNRPGAEIAAWFFVICVGAQCSPLLMVTDAGLGSANPTLTEGHAQPRPSTFVGPWRNTGNRTVGR